MSNDLYERAVKHMPGGVNSPVRAYKAVDRVPRFIASAKGDRITDVDGNEMIDYICSWGPGILGHAHDRVIAKVKEAAEAGLTYGAPTKREVEMAELIYALIPTMEVSRLVSSGTEAVMSAIRVARGYTGRDKIIKFRGCYHGHSDGLLVKAGSAALTTSVPDSAGVPADYTKNTLVAEYNDCDSVKELFDNRLSIGVAQEYFNIKPDLTTLGKIVGGGMPVGAYGGRADIMRMVSPDGPVYQAGTLSGNPIATAAGLETLRILRDNKDIYDRLETKTKRIADSVRKCGAGRVSVNQIGSLMSIFFTPDAVEDYDSAVKSDTKKYAEYFGHMLDNGIYIAPSQFEAMFVSDAHTNEDINRTIEVMEEFFRK